MRVYGLYGKSGTGKSFQAMNLCNRLNVEGIIDDGLFIYKNRVLAGLSAKREKTKIAAIKAALFMDDKRAQTVKNKISEINPNGLLVLGTSVEMVIKIVERLKLNDPLIMISIEEITTQREREHARTERKNHGKHVIPAPTFQIKRQFSGYFLDPMSILRTIGNRKAYNEKTVVRPTYSYLGDFDLSDRVLTDIITYISTQFNEINFVGRIYTENTSDGLIIEIAVVMRAYTKATQALKAFQARVAEEIEAMTALNIKTVDIFVKGIM